MGKLLPPPGGTTAPFHPPDRMIHRGLPRTVNESASLLRARKRLSHQHLLRRRRLLSGLRDDATPAAVLSQFPRKASVGDQCVHDRGDAGSESRILDRGEDLYSAIEIAGHQVGAADPC